MQWKEIRANVTQPHQVKRHRTTLQSSQLAYLKQKYEEDSRPSNERLVQLAAELGLTKRVVMVWFNNTRAKLNKKEKTCSSTLEI